MTTTEKRRSVSPDAATPRTPEERKLEEAFARFKPELLGTLFHLLGNIEDAQDALQDAFVRCWKNRNQLDEIGNLRAWIFRIAYNVGIDALKNAWRRRRKSVDVEELGPVSRENSPEENLLENERVRLLRVAIRRLDEDERVVFLLRQNGALTYEQIAQTIGAPTGTVKTKMRRALAKLRVAAEQSEATARENIAAAKMETTEFSVDKNNEASKENKIDVKNIKTNDVDASIAEKPAATEGER